MRWLLVGVRGAGKSTVGRALAARWQLEFVDLDHEVEARAGQTIAAMFAEAGEAGFRELEHRALAELRARDQVVVATGGGVVLRADNRALLAELGRVIWLDVDAAIASARVATDPGRPPLTDLSAEREARTIAAKRRKLYQGVADHTVRCDRLSVAEVCDELEQFRRAVARHHLR